MKVYVIVCRYILDGNIIDITLSKMLKRLNLEPKILIQDGIEYGVEYGVSDVVRYNVKKAYKVNYILSIKKKKQTTVDLFEYLDLTKEALTLVNFLNNQQDELISKMPKEEFEIKYRNYGNDYTKQIKRR